MREKLQDLRYQVFLYPSCSTDVAPSDCYLSPNMKNWPAGKKFSSSDGVLAESVAYPKGCTNRATCMEEKTRALMVTDLKPQRKQC
ncbi:hypothetical protein AVEN_235436-1 [Araneus ventricosus]|uniref:Uncharacterized protein n=1 Tax=Araneus ventricosus TaxID=182803 RepID=A0A4Y2A495_ARAVE|nr:hypothetical protein AVEN_235436-1 [Araneus ventricosus]